MDIMERKRAEEERERLRQLEADLAHISGSRRSRLALLPLATGEAGWKV